jgi:SagB-type dehydrogenase family enzyme
MFQLLLALSRPVRVADLLAGVEDAQRQKVRAFLEQCQAHGLLTEVHDDGTTEEEQGALAHWEFHDLLFHTSSRFGRNRQAVGATYRLKGSAPPEAHTCAQQDSPQLLRLSEPDIEQLKSGDITLTSALERRRTLYGRRPVSLEALGEFLYRTCRVTSVVEGADGEAFVKKVHPSGGSLHPLEIYVIATACDGLERGLYHYRSLDHALAPLRMFDEEVGQLIEDARRSAGELSYDPPLLLVLSARFRRTAWKYQSIAYRLILMEVGTLYQTMYLVATAMNLAPCALGCGNSDLFARLIGADYYRETSVGEFILGGKD